MASGSDSLRAKVLASIKFWSVVAVLCAIAGAGMYIVGRDYVGQHLHEMEVKQRAPEITPQSGTSTLADDEDTRANPPIQPVVSVHEREPTSREERRARRELERGEDDAAEHGDDEAAADEERDGDEQPDEDARPEAESAESASGGYVVVAGSFADEANAEKHVQRLAERGYQPYITTYEKDGITYRRVTVGMFDSHESAEAVGEKLTSQGFDAMVLSEE